MACLGAILYDPATLETDAPNVMTPFNTTNARIVFTVPASGRVLVRLHITVPRASNSAFYSTYLLGVMEGSTVKGRVSPVGALPSTALVGSKSGQEAVFVVGGLTPSAVLTWDAALCGETLVANSPTQLGGPDNATANDAAGALAFEVWEA